MAGDTSCGAKVGGQSMFGKGGCASNHKIKADETDGSAFRKTSTILKWFVVAAYFNPLEASIFVGLKEKGRAKIQIKGKQAALLNLKVCSSWAAVFAIASSRR